MLCGLVFNFFLNFFFFHFLEIQSKIQATKLNSPLSMLIIKGNLFGNKIEGKNIAKYSAFNLDVAFKGCLVKFIIINTCLIAHTSPLFLMSLMV